MGLKYNEAGFLGSKLFGLKLEFFNTDFGI